MDSNSNYSQFIEHSFRRLSLLIHQQDVLDTPATSNKITEQSSVKTNVNNNFSSPQPIVDDNSADSIKTKVKNEPTSRAYRNYMRPPKNRSGSNFSFKSIIY